MLDKFFKRNGQSASVPDGQRLYAIGDIHGRADMLGELLDEIEADADGLDNATLVFLGDYVDRGPSSRDVIEQLIGLKRDYDDAVFLKGNHEAIMIDFLNEPEDLPHWLDWGGMETLESYGVDLALSLAPETLAEKLREKLPAAHLKFLKTLPLTHIAGDYLFVHAGLRPGAPLEEQTEEDMLWIRKRFHNAPADQRPDYVVVYGHTPEDKPVDAGWRIGVDTGACYGGMLTAVVLEGTDRRFISVKD